DQHDAGPERVPRVEPADRAFVPRRQQRRHDAGDAGEREELADPQLTRVHRPDPAPTVRPAMTSAPAAWARAACSVLRSSIAIVIGPTPPGTGVIADATSTTAAKSTSPTRPLLFWASSGVSRFMPTSITIAPGLTWSRPIRRGLPTAATRMSARAHTPA